MKNIVYYHLPPLNIGITEENGTITQVFFAKERSPAAQGQETPLLRQAAEQLRQYLAGQRQNFSLPLAPRGTEFQMQVWQALQSIPYGQTRSYKQIAGQIGRPAACRAVGMANNRNPIIIIIPCHRVIGANGHLTGYGGGLEVKQHLLGLEARGEKIEIGNNKEGHI